MCFGIKLQVLTKHTKSTRTTRTNIAAERSACHTSGAGSGDADLLEEGIKFARKLPADVFHLPLAHGFLEHAHNGRGMGRCLVGVHPLVLADLLKKVGERIDHRPVRRLLPEVLG